MCFLHLQRKQGVGPVWDLLVIPTTGSSLFGLCPWSTESISLHVGRKARNRAHLPHNAPVATEAEGVGGVTPAQMVIVFLTFSLWPLGRLN